MNKKANTYNMIILAVVAVVAVFGLVLNFSGLTGAWGWSWSAPKIPIIKTCSDGYGITYNTKDYVTYGTSNYYDRCKDSNTLEETVCANNMMSYSSYDCRQQGKSCSDGACISAVVTSTGVDGSSSHAT